MDSEVTTAPVESPLAVKAVGGAVGVGSGLGLVLVAVGLEPDLVARIVGVLAGLIVLVAGYRTAISSLAMVFGIAPAEVLGRTPLPRIGVEEG